MVRWIVPTLVEREPVFALCRQERPIRPGVAPRYAVPVACINPKGDEVAYLEESIESINPRRKRVPCQVNRRHRPGRH